uniref:Uncharacterized protein n=1 Tax=viral metagenome TaxID=1070528 RepID=A0A2V0RC55_9ZZZZ
MKKLDFINRELQQIGERLKNSDLSEARRENLKKTQEGYRTRLKKLREYPDGNFEVDSQGKPLNKPQTTSSYSGPSKTAVGPGKDSNRESQKTSSSNRPMEEMEVVTSSDTLPSQGLIAYNRFNIPPCAIAQRRNYNVLTRRSDRMGLRRSLATLNIYFGLDQVNMIAREVTAMLYGTQDFIKFCRAIGFQDYARASGRTEALEAVTEALHFMCLKHWDYLYKKQEGQTYMTDDEFDLSTGSFQVLPGVNWFHQGNYFLSNSQYTIGESDYLMLDCQIPSINSTMWRETGVWKAIESSNKAQVLEYYIKLKALTQATQKMFRWTRPALNLKSEVVAPWGDLIIDESGGLYTLTNNNDVTASSIGLNLIFRTDFGIIGSLQKEELYSRFSGPIAKILDTEVFFIFTGTKPMSLMADIENDFTPVNPGSTPSSPGGPGGIEDLVVGGSNVGDSEGSDTGSPSGDSSSIVAINQQNQAAVSNQVRFRPVFNFGRQIAITALGTAIGNFSVNRRVINNVNTYRRNITIINPET